VSIGTLVTTGLVHATNVVVANCTPGSAVNTVRDLSADIGVKTRVGLVLKVFGVSAHPTSVTGYWGVLRLTSDDVIPDRDEAYLRDDRVLVLGSHFFD
jgi:hypothetical protein